MYFRKQAYLIPLANAQVPVFSPPPAFGAQVPAWPGVPSVLPHGLLTAPGLSFLGPTAPVFVMAAIPPAGPTLAGQRISGATHPLASQVAPVPGVILQPYMATGLAAVRAVQDLSLIHISEPTRRS